MSSIATLESWFEKTSKVLVALSGGVDSCLVAFLSRKFLGKTFAPAVISVSASLKNRDLLIARKFCNKYDIHLEEISGQEINDEKYLSNPVNRCFYCKSSLYISLRSIIDNGNYSVRVSCIEKPDTPINGTFYLCLCSFFVASCNMSAPKAKHSYFFTGISKQSQWQQFPKLVTWWKQITTNPFRWNQQSGGQCRQRF